ncbi:four helix bundle protein [Candidatus Roizmanbacteria bacterium]|nr:four helix bundle protein [Candidatus Roizmanbacteria bacterium]
MINQIQNSNNKYDLEERTAKFGESIILFIKTLPINIYTEPLIKQIIRSATSIGANYMEANGCDSKKDFKNKISLCKKEAKETTHWIRMLSITIPKSEEKLRRLWKEAHELVLIFSAITKRCIV